MNPRSLIVVLISVFLATAGATPPGLDDPGEGDDAGDSPGDATVLDAEGTYNGTLVPPGDADWYKLETTSAQDPGPVCSKAIVEGNVHADVTLSSTLGLNPAVTRPIEPGLRLDLGLSVPTTQVYLGLEPSQEATPAPASGGTYQFDLLTVEPGDTDGDAGTGDDAGEDPATGIATEGPCIDGTLSDETDSDVYVFDGIQGEHVALSLSDATSQAVFVNLTAPSGALVSQVDPGGFTDVSLNETGQWIVRTDLPHETDATGSDYLVGLTVNGPEPRPCEPSCFMR